MSPSTQPSCRRLFPFSFWHPAAFGLAPFFLLAFALMVGGRDPLPAHAAGLRSPADGCVAAGAQQDGENCTLAAALSSSDPYHLQCARGQYRVLRRVQAHLAATRSVAASRYWQEQEARAQKNYALCYHEITPPARHRAHLPVPPGG